MSRGSSGFNLMVCPLMLCQSYRIFESPKTGLKYVRLRSKPSAFPSSAIRSRPPPLLSRPKRSPVIREILGVYLTKANLTPLFTVALPATEASYCIKVSQCRNCNQDG